MKDINQVTYMIYSNDIVVMEYTIKQHLYIDIFQFVNDNGELFWVEVPEFVIEGEKPLVTFSYEFIGE